MMTLFMILIPTIEVPLINDLLTSTLIGGVLAGYGSGTILSSGGSGGGTDIIGIIVSMKNRNLSVGKLGLIINICIYSICGVFFGIPTMIYSILSSIFSTIMVDRRHDQNVCSMAFIFTKNEPSKLIKFIREELSRDSTYWEGVGGYQNTTTYITYTSLSRYELQRLERHLTEIDKTAFLVKNDGVGIKGNFKKYL